MHGYGACAGYHVLRSRASVDAQFEMQTFVCLTRLSTESEINQILNDFKVNEPLLVEAEAAAILASEAEAAVAVQATAADTAAVEAAMEVGS